MESTRRPYARSLSKEQPGLKKPRLSVVPTTSDGRPGFNQPRRLHMDRDSDSSDSLPSEHQELVSQYKIALSELTFNSKPIITNLSIIAGENLHAAKAIAATVCAHVIEVAPEQKLPSLYLLDSIVKNIGKDYIKYFASRLPEVFCKAYWQVDPSTHQGMRHLFGTWKAVFPPQVLQVIEKELGFTTTSNGSSSGVAVSRADSQVQRPGHGIHVNPKYLEARQQLQTSRARGSSSDTSGAMVSSLKNAEPIQRNTTISSEKSWADPFVKAQIHHIDQTNEPVRGKFSSMASLDTDYGSNVPGLSGVATSRVNESFKEQGLSKPWRDYGSSISGNLSDQTNRAGKKAGLEGSASQKSTDLRLQHDQNFSFRNANGISKNWQNSEEEEYLWDEMNSKPTDRVTANNLAKDHWMADNDDRLDVDMQYQEPQNLHDSGSRIEDEPSVDSAPHEMTRVNTIAQVPFSWSEELHPSEASPVSGPGNDILASKDYHTGLRSSSDMASRTPYRSQQSKPPIQGQSFKFSESNIPGIKVTAAQQPQTHGAAQSAIRRLSSSSVSKSNSIQPLHTSAERNQMSTGPPIDPRRPMLQRGATSRDQSSSLRLQPSTSLPPSQQKKYIPSQQGKIKASEFESGVKKHSPVQSAPNSLLNARTKDQVLGIDSSIKPSSQKVGPQPTLGAARPPSPNATNPAPNPVSSLLSSLVAKGLISASSSDKLSSTPSQKPTHPADVASLPLAKGKSPSITDEKSSFEAAAKPSIGFDFKPAVIRKFHPDVVADLVSDLPHRCDICGVKLKFQELLDRHMEWHASRVSERDTSDKMSRKWYSSSLDWVIGSTYLRADSLDVMGESDEVLESCEQMVPADDSQCACIFCGELFEDFYSLDRNEWMFKGAVYLAISSSESQESFESNPSRNLIVHSHCMSEDSLHALGLSGNVQGGLMKLEED